MTGIHDLIKVYGAERARELVEPAKRPVLEIARRPGRHAAHSSRRLLSHRRCPLHRASPRCSGAVFAVAAATTSPKLAIRSRFGRAGMLPRF